MKLVTADDVRHRLGSSINSNVFSSVDSILDAATIQIENILGTPLVKSTRIDWFSYNPGRYETGFSYADLMVTQSFIESVSGVYLSTDGLPIEESDISGMASVLTSLYSVFYDKGHIALRSYPKKGLATIAVQYVSGFDDENDVNIPYWLKEAALSATVRLIHSQSLKHSKKDMDMSRELRMILFSMVNEHIRPRRNGIPPCSTKVMDNG